MWPAPPATRRCRFASRRPSCQWLPAPADPCSLLSPQCPPPLPTTTTTHTHTHTTTTLPQFRPEVLVLPPMCPPPPPPPPASTLPQVRPKVLVLSPMHPPPACFHPAAGPSGSALPVDERSGNNGGAAAAAGAAAWAGSRREFGKSQRGVWGGRGAGQHGSAARCRRACSTGQASPSRPSACHLLRLAAAPAQCLMRLAPSLPARPCSCTRTPPG